MINGHVASTASQAFKDKNHLCQLLAGSSKNTFYTTKRLWMTKTMAVYKQWARHHGLPSKSSENWHQLMQVQWDNQYKTLQENPNSFKFNHVVTIKKDTECMVVHNEDHEPTKFMLYCPKLFFQFGTKDIRRRESVSKTRDFSNGTPREVQRPVPGSIVQEIQVVFQLGKPAAVQLHFRQIQETIYNGQTGQ